MVEQADDVLAERLCASVYASPWLMQALHATRALNLPDWCIGAGVIRRLVWDLAHGREALPHTGSDIDLCYYDTGDISRERDVALQAELQKQLPMLTWEVVNQAGVHTWFRDNDPAISPFTSLTQAIASWPETATAVAVRLDADNQLHVIAPYGLTDLFGLWIRPNPGCNLATFHKRVVEKQYAAHWPLVKVEMA
ncbi:nucleotidyltransferase family protein [Chitinimonas sp. PSY-7]|uniref:nucleotidyltransferase family protein n=1 Tax=Chitinimonas sp. PSY-7 TaxID=3459088 RepID=UPI004040062D